jgi:FSR family fosmidomycin resistance protein-like MFS transporter
LDELVSGAWTAAWPLVRADLDLSYVQVGVLLSAPNLLANILEPAVGVLGDAWDRRALVRAGGVAFAGALVLVALGDGFLPLLAALTLLSPASGAFVGLSQATLMDADPGARERNMARWALAGSVGMVGGPLVVGAATYLGAGWRAPFAALALPALLLVVVISASWPTMGSPCRHLEATPNDRTPLGVALVRGAGDLARALRRREVVRWLALLEFADLLLDVLYGYLALYFMDVLGASSARAGIAVAVWTVVGLLGDAFLIPLLARVSGIHYLRASALAMLVVFPAFLLANGTVPKLILLGLLGLLNAGWYAILKGRLYAAMPGQSATVLALGNVFGLAGSLLPLAIGLAAEWHGLGAAMWLLLLGPLALLVGLPRRGSAG